MNFQLPFACLSQAYFHQGLSYLSLASDLMLLQDKTGQILLAQLSGELHDLPPVFSSCSSGSMNSSENRGLFGPVLEFENAIIGTGPRGSQKPLTNLCSKDFLVSWHTLLPIRKLKPLYKIGRFVFWCGRNKLELFKVMSFVRPPLPSPQLPQVESIGLS